MFQHVRLFRSPCPSSLFCAQLGSLNVTGARSRSSRIEKCIFLPRPQRWTRWSVAGLNLSLTFAALPPSIETARALAERRDAAIRMDLSYDSRFVMMVNDFLSLTVCSHLTNCSTLSASTILQDNPTS